MTLICVYVCTHVCMYICTYVRMYVCMYVVMHLCTYIHVLLEYSTCCYRVCVQADLPHPLFMQLDIMLLKTNISIPTSHLHVQSISHWAPANIGPYSQAFKVS